MKKKKKISKVNFLRQKKSLDTLFQNVVRKNTVNIYYKSGEFKKLDGLKELAKDFKVHVNTLNSWRKFGVPNKVQKTKKFQNILDAFVEMNEIDLSHNVTKLFRRVNFTFDEFSKFFNRSVKAQRGGRLLFRAQAVFKMKNGYIIDSYNWSVYSKQYKDGVKKLFAEIKETIDKWKKSDPVFWFNFLVVEKHFP